MSGAGGAIALIRAAVRSTAGNDGRGNEDRGAADPMRGLLLVADGMGGLPLATASAERAATMVGESLEVGSDDRALLSAVEGAGKAVADMAQTAGVRRSGTTLCVGLVHLNRLLVANLGDSRSYLVRDGVATTLTVDHTPAARLIADGTIEAGSPAANELSRSLDRYLGRGSSTPDLDSYEVRPGDRLLFCTDGVYRVLSHEALTELVAGPGRPAEVAEALIDAAREAGSTDDATAVVADVGVRPTGGLALSSAVGGALLALGENATVGRVGAGADIGFDDRSLHSNAARLSLGNGGWTLENTGIRLSVVVRDRREVMSRSTIAPLRSSMIPYPEADVIFTTRRGEHTLVVTCPGVDSAGGVVASVAPGGTGYSYPLEHSTAQFRTLVAICEPLLRDRKWGGRLSEKAIVRRLRPVEPEVTLKKVSRRIDELCKKILGPGVRDLQALAEKSIITGTVTSEHLSLIEPPPRDL